MSGVYREGVYAAGVYSGSVPDGKAAAETASELHDIAAVVNAPATRQQTQVAVNQANAALRATTPGTTPTPPAVVEPGTVEPGVIDPGTVPPADPVLPTTTR